MTGRLLGAIATVFFALSRTLAAEVLPIQVDQFHTALNKSFREGKASLRVVRTGCKQGKSAVCQYQIGRDTFAMVAGQLLTSKATDIQVFSPTKGTELSHTETVAAYVGIMSALSPQDDPAERAAVMTVLMSGLTSSDREGVAELGTVRYEVSAGPKSIWFKVRPVK